MNKVYKKLKLSSRKIQIQLERFVKTFKNVDSLQINFQNRLKILENKLVQIG